MYSLDGTNDDAANYTYSYPGPGYNCSRGLYYGQLQLQHAVDYSDQRSEDANLLSSWDPHSGSSTSSSSPHHAVMPTQATHGAVNLEAVDFRIPTPTRILGSTSPNNSADNSGRRHPQREIPRIRRLPFATPTERPICHQCDGKKTKMTFKSKHSLARHQAQEHGGPIDTLYVCRGPDESPFYHCRRDKMKKHSKATGHIWGGYKKLVDRSRSLAIGASSIPAVLFRCLNRDCTILSFVRSELEQHQSVTGHAYDIWLLHERSNPTNGTVVDHSSDGSREDQEEEELQEDDADEEEDDE